MFCRCCDHVAITLRTACILAVSAHAHSQFRRRTSGVRPDDVGDLVNIDVDDALAAAARRQRVVAHAEHVRRPLVAHIHVRRVADGFDDVRAGRRVHEVRQAGSVWGDDDDGAGKGPHRRLDRRRRPVRVQLEGEARFVGDRHQRRLDGAGERETAHAGALDENEGVTRRVHAAYAVAIQLRE